MFLLVLIILVILVLINGMKPISIEGWDWDWLSICISGILLPQLHPQIAAAQTLASNDVFGKWWKSLYQKYFGFISGQWAEVDMRCPSLYRVQECDMQHGSLRGSSCVCHGYNRCNSCMNNTLGDLLMSFSVFPLSKLSHGINHSCFSCGMSLMETLWQLFWFGSTIQQNAKWWKGPHHLQMMLMYFSWLAQKIPPVCCGPAALTYTFVFISFTGFSWFCLWHCLPQRHRRDQRFLSSHVFAISSSCCVFHHPCEKVDVTRGCRETKSQFSWWIPLTCRWHYLSGSFSHNSGAQVADTGV